MVKKKVMLIDDEEDFLNILKLNLENPASTKYWPCRTRGT